MAPGSKSVYFLQGKIWDNADPKTTYKYKVVEQGETVHKKQQEGEEFSLGAHIFNVEAKI